MKPKMYVIIFVDTLRNVQTNKQIIKRLDESHEKITFCLLATLENAQTNNLTSDSTKSKWSLVTACICKRKT